MNAATSVTMHSENAAAPDHRPQTLKRKRSEEELLTAGPHHETETAHAHPVKIEQDDKRETAVEDKGRKKRVSNGDGEVESTSDAQAP